jgi:UDP-N-acetylmuramoyl-tripeptide--D-alanyl-D-alanine ligase
MDVFDRTDEVTVVDDSYNANPASMAAALRALADLSRGRRSWAVLGYMAELGAQEVTGHLEVGRLAAELGIDRLVAVGDEAAAFVDGAIEVTDWEGEALRVPDQEAAIELLAGAVCPGDVVLVKGSRYRTWLVADALRGEQGIRVDEDNAASRRSGRDSLEGEHPTLTQPPALSPVALEEGKSA